MRSRTRVFMLKKASVAKKQRRKLRNSKRGLLYLASAAVREDKRLAQLYAEFQLHSLRSPSGRDCLLSEPRVRLLVPARLIGSPLLRWCR